MLSVPSCRVLFQLHVMSALPAPVVPGVQPVEFFSAPLFRAAEKGMKRNIQPPFFLLFCSLDFTERKIT
jgi:hypothetical protein